MLDTDRDLLLRLLALPTAGPLEAGHDAPVRLWEAQHEYARAASAFGMTTVHHAPVTAAALACDDVPLAVRSAAATPGFLDAQPSLVLRLGPALPVSATVMFNVHLDTVSGHEPVTFDGTRFTGRGAIDAKGPAVAVLAGVRAAAAAHPAIGRDVAVLVQAVSGEEGGAMGTIGTRPLVAAGWYGRLNVFCEPTGLRYLPRATAAMTACVRVDGDGAIDDRPETGHNATVLLGFLAQHLGYALAGEGVCVAGLHTGRMHNRVYGTGRLLLNIGYATPESGARRERALRAALDEGLAAFTARFGGVREFARTATDATKITTLEWHKRGLPTLTGCPPWCTDLFAEAGIARWPADEPAFTCDAIWLHDRPGTATVVLGPGSLSDNNAHACGEYADLADLERFAAAVTTTLHTFAAKGQP
ncbi:M20/M25/M40 family metallo-hydrolase [Actinophytocola sp. NPDC049390]|uniref:M20/M25/M40 family metallo-hydrolase n=1 Tax=Actinophytocola sp. NPDC049390 TaxID=3363894 RepID=UPI003797044C